MAELLKNFEPEIARITLIPADGGAFEVMVNDKLVFSKLQSGRHTDPAEVSALVEQLTLRR